MNQYWENIRTGSQVKDQLHVFYLPICCFVHSCISYYSMFMDHIYLLKCTCAKRIIILYIIFSIPIIFKYCFQVNLKEFRRSSKTVLRGHRNHFKIIYFFIFRSGCNAGHLGSFILLENDDADKNTSHMMKVNLKRKY